MATLMRDVEAVAQANTEDARRQEIETALRIDGDKHIFPGKERFAARLLDVCRKKRLMNARQKPLRRLAGLADIAPQRLEVWITTDITPDRSSIDKLATVTKVKAAQWMALLLDNEMPGDPSASSEESSLSDGDRAILDAIGHWPDEEKYDLADHLQRVQRLGQSDNDRE